jgi:hypothetical protein
MFPLRNMTAYVFGSRGIAIFATMKLQNQIQNYGHSQNGAFWHSSPLDESG